MYKNYYLNTA